MAALTINDITVGQKLKFASKKDPSVKYKCEAESIDKKAKKVTVKTLEGPNEGSSYTMGLERLSRVQGRQPGFSPASKKNEEKPTTNKPNGKTNGSKPAKKTEESEELNLKSAKAEILDIVELLQDLGQRLNVLHTFMEGYDDSEEDADEEGEDADESDEPASPAPAPKGRRRKPMSEDD